MNSNVDSNIHININGVDIDWDLKNGNLNFLGISSTLFWNDPSLLNMFKPLVDEIGKDMFRLQVAYSSSLGTKEDYNAMVTQLGDSFEEGFLNWGKAVSGAGWGIFELPFFDIKNFKAKVIVHNPWELQMQKNLPSDEQWGCPFMQGKIIGIFSNALDNLCWANEKYYITKEQTHVEFDIYLNDETIEERISKLKNKKEKEQIVKLRNKIEQSIEEKNELLKKEEKLRNNLIEAQSLAKIGSWTLDLGKNKLEWSDEIFNIFEIKKENFEASYEYFLSVIHPEDIEKVNNAYSLSIENKQPYDVTHRLLLKNGKIKYVQERGQTYYNDDGTAIYSSGTVQDITNRKEREKALRESELRWKFAVEGSGDGLWDWNLVDNSVFFSKQWKKMLGFLDHEISGSLEEWDKRVHPEDKEQTYHDVNEHLEGKVQQYQNEHRVLCKDGEYKWVLDRGIIVQRDEQGKPTRMIGTHTDISKRKEIEETLQSAKELAEKTSQSKSDFLANMSHEIRTPLNGVIGLTGIVLKTDLDETQRNYLEKSRESSKALLHVINDILDYSKIEAGKLTLENNSFELDDIANNLKNLFEFQAGKKGLSLECHNEYKKSLIGDSFRLMQIFTNLIGNAIKFTKDGSVHFIIEKESEDLDSVGIKFTVKDSGIGMSKEVQENLFSEFMQADTSTTRKFGGTGLGLAISKQLVELMGGDIRVISKEDIGSEFIFDVSFKKDEMITENTEEISSPEINYKLFKGKNILLVEDNKVNQLVVSGILEDLEVNIDIANNGKEAVEKYAKEKYSLILMDLQMPIMDGFEASEKIRQLDLNIPIIALSAAVMKEDKEHTKKSGMNAHIAKPIDYNELVSTLTELLSRV